MPWANKKHGFFYRLYKENWRSTIYLTNHQQGIRLSLATAFLYHRSSMWFSPMVMGAFLCSLLSWPTFWLIKFGLSTFMKLKLFFIALIIYFCSQSQRNKRLEVCDYRITPWVVFLFQRLMKYPAWLNFSDSIWLFFIKLQFHQKKRIIEFNQGG